MQLFLSSSNEGLHLIAQKLPKKGRGLKVILSSNATDNIPGNHPWVSGDIKAFEKMGAKVLPVDLRKMTKVDFVKMLKAFDLIHFTGGSPLTLLLLLKQKGFDSLISLAVKKGKIIYSGTSAGSMIAPDDVTLLTYDEDEKEYVKELKDFKGLGLVDFLFLPHGNQQEFISYAQSIVGYLPKHHKALVLINDKQVASVTEKGVEIMTGGK
ncbi:MAG: Type 1 glutamine amidotransferase-like domain-containing protein [Candidatus Paceibacterota bacterium]|jgi:peptidase E